MMDGERNHGAMHLKPQRYEGIEGLVGSDPVGAILTVGTKGPSGAPVDKDRFYLKSSIAHGEAGKLSRDPHPAFAAFNSADPSKRRSIRGNVVHSKWSDCFEVSLRAQRIKGMASHPRGIPTCTGDGIKATRYFGKTADDTDDFREIECPNELCPMRIGRVKECKPAVRFLFRINWNEGVALPRILVRFSSSSWNTAKAFKGFHSYIDSQAKAFGLSDYSLFGIPFVMTLSEKTNPEEKTRFPVVTITPDFDLQEFFAYQRKQLASFGGRTLELPAPIHAPENSDPEVIAADFAEIAPGHPIAKPAERDEVIDSEPVEPPHVRRIRLAATERGLTEEDVLRIAGGNVADSPASAELEILRGIREHRKRK